MFEFKPGHQIKLLLFCCCWLTPLNMYFEARVGHVIPFMMRNFNQYMRWLNTQNVIQKVILLVRNDEVC